MSENVSKGLEGVVAAETALCRIDGAAGRLSYLGYAVEDLAAHCSFEETVFLLLFGELPDAGQREAFARRMRSGRDLPAPVLDMVAAFPPAAHPMELLQSGVAYLSGSVKHRIQHSATCNCRDTLHQIAQLPSVVAAVSRFRAGLAYVPPRDDLSHGANFLWMLHGSEPDPLDGEAMDRSLVLHAEHGLNASTFTARVVASTLSTCYCSIASAMGALYGSLHGGANEKALAQAEDVGAPENAKGWVERTLAAGGKIMGMGHRVYKARDPRAGVIERDLESLAGRRGDRRLLDVLRALEAAARAKMEEAGKPVYPNVDFFSGALYAALGIPAVLFTPVFAMARAAGWLAHILEQRVDNRLVRPSSRYRGPEPRAVPPVGERPPAPL